MRGLHLPEYYLGEYLPEDLPENLPEVFVQKTRRRILSRTHRANKVNISWLLYGFWFFFLVYFYAIFDFSFLEFVVYVKGLVSG